MEQKVDTLLQADQYNWKRCVYLLSRGFREMFLSRAGKLAMIKVLMLRPTTFDVCVKCEALDGNYHIQKFCSNV